jgi:hypothetical protein
MLRSGASAGRYTTAPSCMITVASTLGGEGAPLGEFVMPASIVPGQAEGLRSGEPSPPMVFLWSLRNAGSLWQGQPPE